MEELYTEMLTWPLEEQAKYVRGLADGEGGPRFYRFSGERRGHHHDGDPHIRAVVISNTDKALLLTVQKMLENLGIRSRMYLDAQKGHGKSTKDAWILKVLDGKSISKYAVLVGFSIPHKMELLRQIVASYKRIKMD